MSAFDPQRALDLGPTRFSRVHFGELNEFPSLEELFPGKQGETLRCIDSGSCTISTERPWNAVWFKEFDQMVAT